MTDTKFPFRGCAYGISGWIPLEKPVNADYRVQLCMSRPAKVKYHNIKFPGFAQPKIDDFGKFYLIQPNPHYVKPAPKEIFIKAKKPEPKPKAKR